MRKRLWWAVLFLWAFGCERGTQHEELRPIPPAPNSGLRPPPVPEAPKGSSSTSTDANPSGLAPSQPESATTNHVPPGALEGNAGELEGSGLEPVLPDGLPRDADYPRPIHSELVCTIMGRDVQRQPEVIGADLGVSYTAGDRIEWLFGDTWATARPPTNNDDAFATMEGIVNGRDAEAICQREPLPMRLGSDEEGNLLPITAGPLLDGFKAPVTGFAWGDDEYAIFSYFKPQACRQDDDCRAGLSCEPRLGYVGAPPNEEGGFTLPCKDGSVSCISNTITTQPSGLCVDEDLQGGSSAGDLVASASMYMRFGIRSKSKRSEYSTQDFVTTRFQNVTAVVVGEDWTTPSGDEGARRSGRALLFGRPGFLGTASRSLPMYLAYVDLPWSGTPQLHFFTGLDEQGEPRFSDHEQDSVPLDLSAGRGDPTERYDVVNQSAIRYVKELKRWVMFYGGGVSTMPRILLLRCGIAEIFAPADCAEAEVGNGAIRVRWALSPWGPWSEPRDVVVAGDVESDEPADQYGPGGLLRHPACTAGDCAPHQGLPNFVDEEYGFFYAPNIIEPWTWVEEGMVHFYWNVSTWNPYRIVLMKSSFAF